MRQKVYIFSHSFLAFNFGCYFVLRVMCKFQLYTSEASVDKTSFGLFCAQVIVLCRAVFYITK